MKKLIAVLALLLVASMVLVACDNNSTDPEVTTPEETTPEVTTPEDTTLEDTTPEDTTSEDTTPEQTTPEDTTPEETTEPEPVKVVVGISFDAMGKVYGEEIDMENLFFSSGTEYNTWSKVAEIDQKVDSLKVAGWVAFFTETEGVLGYSIDGAAAVYPESFSYTAEQDVMDYVSANLPGGKSAARMFSDVPVADLAVGEHTVALMAKNADGNEEAFAEFKLVKVDNSYKVDLSGVTVTGSYPTVYTGANAQFNTTPAVGADGYVINLHYGSIYLGEIDLSLYSKVTVTYGTATDGVMADSNFAGEYQATQQRVLLLNTLSNAQEGTPFELLPEEDAVIATAHYEMSNGWMAVTTVEIDLSAVDYNGQVYLSFDFRNAANELGALGYLLAVTGVVFE